ncbi:homoprotocatechuate degradation operon regulator, HpaR [Xenorhabdus mauleonii]|uniref:DNA-binding transcriptional regulator, MarR family n=1 Tax=Xenorhabdus mauleonii TaxID=351675 RepID=A0A1I3VJB7_9GAMM|nr:MarR family transcriptional regulator [Xenorhabdus mauleonii]PHM37441.1 homoprotocatechuate degradation operon regulator, HpaR [Xenorhabdus mauleonii]SFJ95262.1 DNA-binding transcriptional regulator, MarR family [Xenorhabdus mauleonii]
MNSQLILWHKLQHLFDSAENFVAKRLQSKHSIGMSEYRALHLLSSAPKSELRMQELASLLNLNQSSVSRLVERLERNNYTFRDTCLDDKRRIYTVLTSTGNEKYIEVKSEYETAILEVLEEQKSDSLNKKLIEAIFSVTGSQDNLPS